MNLYFGIFLALIVAGILMSLRVSHLRSRSGWTAGLIPGYSAKIGSPIHFEDGTSTSGSDPCSWKLVRLEEVSTPNIRTRVVATLESSGSDMKGLRTVVGEMSQQLATKYNADVLLVIGQGTDIAFRSLRCADGRGWTGGDPVQQLEWEGELTAIDS